MKKLKILLLSLVIFPLLVNAGGKNCNLEKCDEEDIKNIELINESNKIFDKEELEIENYNKSEKKEITCTLSGCNLDYGVSFKGDYIPSYYILGKIDKIDLDNKMISFNNYVHFDKVLLRDFFKFSYIKLPLKYDFKINDFPQGGIFDFYKKYNPKYVISYVNNYTKSIVFSSIIDCSKTNLTIITNGTKIFPTFKDNNNYLSEKLFKFKNCADLDNYFKKERRYELGLNNGFDVRIIYFSVLFGLVIFILSFSFYLKKIQLGKK